MKVKKISALIGLVFLILGVYGGWCVYHFYQTPGPRCVLSDASFLSSLSPAILKKVTLFFKEYGKKYATAELFSVALRAEFPFLKDITCEQSTAKKVAVTVGCARPLFVFNDALALTDQGTELDVAVYRQDLVTALPHFTVAHYEKGQSLPRECIEYVKQLNPTVPTLYEVEWVDSSLIKFHDKQYPHITVLGAADTQGEKLLHYSCDVLKMALLERKPSRKGQENDWCIDMRFKGQMVVFPGGKEAHEKAVYG